MSSLFIGADDRTLTRPAFQQNNVFGHDWFANERSSTSATRHYTQFFRQLAASPTTAAIRLAPTLVFHGLDS